MKNANVTELVQPGEFKDQLTEVLREGARDLIVQAVEAEFATFLQNHEDEREGHDDAEWHKIWDEAELFYFTKIRPPSSFDLVIIPGSSG